MITVCVAGMLHGACEGLLCRAPPVQAVGLSAVPTSPCLLHGGAAGRGTTVSLQALEALALRGTDALKAQANTHMMDKTHYRGIACRRRRLVASIMALILGSVITEPLAGNAAPSPARPRNDDKDYGIDDEEASSLVSLY